MIFCGTSPEISIHALREEGDVSIEPLFPLWQRNFYPRPPRGGRRVMRINNSVRVKISIHALREEGDAFYDDLFDGFLQFLSTPSARRATGVARDVACAVGDFYPRPPRGGRQSTCTNLAGCSKISIHALREEGDEMCASGNGGIWQFLSTPSARRATTGRTKKMSTGLLFLSTPSARRATHSKITLAASWIYFYPRPPRGGRRFHGCHTPTAKGISIHALREEGDHPLLPEQ